MADGPMITEAEAMKKLCPLSYSQPGGALNCIGSGCMLWVRATSPGLGPFAQAALDRLSSDEVPPPLRRDVGCCGLTGAAR